MQTLDVISVNLWQILASLLNLVILFLIVKKFLYRPVKKFLAERQEKLDGELAAAQNARQDAENDREAYRLRLDQAETDAEHVVRAAEESARRREGEMLQAAREKADGIVRRAEEDAVMERLKAQEEIRQEIVEVSSLLTEKLLEREVNEEDQRRLVDSFLDEMNGEANDES